MLDPCPCLQRDAVLGMLRSKLQEEGLRTYLLAYGRFYSSLSIAQLCDMFELPERKVGAACAGLPRSFLSCTDMLTPHFWYVRLCKTG